MPNLPVDVDSWGRSACYPQGNFYPLTQARGISLPDLVERVLAKADAFAVASGFIIGQRQALEDRLDACTTLEEVQGITVNISMPGGGEA